MNPRTKLSQAHIDLFNEKIDINPPDIVAQNCKTYANLAPAGKPFTDYLYNSYNGGYRTFNRTGEKQIFCQKV